MNATCKVYNRTPINFDGFECGLLKFEADLYFYDFGYICMGPLGLILVISIFGKIKENYRWLILNQVIWDLFVSTNYSCYTAISIGVKPAPSCFYMAHTYIPKITNFIRFFDTFLTDIINYNPYSSLLLLTTLRFLALYFPRIYDELTKGKRILFTIIIFTIFIVIFDINAWFLLFQLIRAGNLLDECALQQNISRDVCSAKRDYLNDSWYQLMFNLSSIFTILKYFKPLIFIFFSIIATFMIIIKMVKQAKFQYQHNRKNFNASLRITVTISLQTVIYCFSFVIEAFSKFLPQLISTLKLKIRTTRNNAIGRDYTGYLDMRLPEWFDSIDGLTSDISRQMIVQFRILVESIIVLTIMTGYREAVIDFLKFMYKIIRNPKRTFKTFFKNKSKVSETTVF